MKEKTLEMLRKVCHDLVEVSKAVREDTNEVVRGTDHVDVIVHYNHVRLTAAAIKEAREAIKGIEDSLSREIVPDFMRNAKIKTVTIEGVGRVTVAHRYSCTMLDKPAAMQHLRDIGQGGLIQETVASPTLSAFAKNWMEEEGKELPPELFKVGTSPYTSITKVK